MGFQFGNLDNYAVGGYFTEGDYSLDHRFAIYGFPDRTGTEKAPNTLCVQVTMTDAEGKTREQYYSCGGAASKSWTPSADGLSVDPVNGGPEAPFQERTNWHLYLQSLINAGLPEGTIDDNLGPINGIVAHMAEVPEPAGRSEMRARDTSEGGGKTKKDEPKKVVVPQEIKSMPGEKPKAAAKGPAKATTAAVAKAPAKTAAAPAPAAPAIDATELLAEKIAGVLSEQPTITKAALMIRINNSLRREKVADSVLKSVASTFQNNEELAGLLGVLGFQLEGANISAM